MTKDVAVAQASILAKMAGKYSLPAKNLHETLAQTIFPNKNAATPEHVQALLIVADQYDLNPFTKEIYAFPGKGGGIIPVVSVDGWLKMANDNPQFDGMDIDFEDDADGKPISCTCTIHRKDRNHPIKITEYYSENRRTTDPWKTNPHRMLRHRAVIQAIRTAFSFSGIYEPDEAASFADTPLPPREVEIIDAFSTALEAPAEAKEETEVPVSDTKLFGEEEPLEAWSSQE